MSNNHCVDYNVLRQQLLAKRKMIPVSKRDMDSQRLCSLLWEYCEQHFKPPLLIAAFWPIGHEIDIKPLLFKLDQAGFHIILPKVLEKDAPLHFFRWTSQSPMTVGHFNIPEPLTSEEIHLTPDIVFTPLVGFTRQGDRLGYGKGYYDRTLATWIARGQDPLTIGLSWDEGLIEDSHYQAAEHDIPLKRILTPSGWVLY